jgi:hypothetical protein
MQRTELAHVLRASADIAQEKIFVLVGSQAILLLLDSPPAELLRSTEVDLYPAMHPEKSDLIDGAIGALSAFHDTFGYHADGVSPETASLPTDWMDRAVFTYIDDLTAICPDLHDLAVSKCVAGRDKDADFIRALFKHAMLSLPTMVERIALLNGAKYPLAHITQWTQRRAQEANQWI